MLLCYIIVAYVGAHNEGSYHFALHPILTFLLLPPLWTLKKRMGCLLWLGYGNTPWATILNDIRVLKFIQKSYISCHETPLKWYFCTFKLILPKFTTLCHYLDICITIPQHNCSLFLYYLLILDWLWHNSTILTIYPQYMAIQTSGYNNDTFYSKPQWCVQDNIVSTQAS